ncbi:PTS system glucose-specific EIIA component [Paraliobacillus quinghaiensis]|uniref:PTS system glucose-specific EIIA component n=1 Tax=Paraliobacillus quinghaiensis TaxID=470815 RepID=A0A917TNG4_9BACI|nr:PTS glucose transporter subunit IIA [Paraliobacillus quinghaiensis]GGM30218.1 PTS system glucose-specific EIIA component [Paraliobacillus quinghaiensis]
MFKKLFGKKEEHTKIEQEKVLAPVTGELVELSEVPDPTFSEKMMGDGVAIKPTNGAFVAPVTGEVVNLFPTKHAIGIKSEAGVEYLIHIGLETVALDGEGFEAHVKQGDKVSAGDLLVTVDLETVGAKANLISPVVITNEVASVQKEASAQSVVKGETVIMTIDMK